METLFGLALKSLLIAGLTLLLLQATRRRSAAERSWIAHAGLVALVALPLASLALPPLHVDLPTAFAEPAKVEAPLALSEPSAADSFKTSTDAAESEAAGVVEPAPIDIDWTPYAYAAPAIALLLVTLIALLRLFALRARAQVLVDPAWLSALAHAQRRMGFKHGTALLTSNELSSPISWGLMRPVILLNDEALEARGEAEAIIAHELAHVARLDWLKLMLARVATAVFWFNPLAWILAREAHQLREEAADDAVLAANIVDTDYAQLLVGIARHECKGLLLGAHGVAPSESSLKRRVRRVLDGSLARSPATASWVAGFGAGMLVMSAPLAALTFAPREEEQPKAPVVARQAAPAVASSVAATVEQVVSDAVPKAVAAAVATAAHPHQWSEADSDEVEAAADAAEAAADAAEERADRLREKKDAIDTVIEMKALGLTPEYAAQIRAASPRLRNIDLQELVELRAKGATPQLIRALTAAGYGNASADSIGDAAALGVSADYVREIRASGFRGVSLDDLVELRAMGVTGDYIASFRRAGRRPLTARQLVKMRAHGIGPDDLVDRSHVKPRPLPPPPRVN